MSSVSGSIYQILLSSQEEIEFSEEEKKFLSYNDPSLLYDEWVRESQVYFQEQGQGQDQGQGVTPYLPLPLVENLVRMIRFSPEKLPYSQNWLTLLCQDYYFPVLMSVYPELYESYFKAEQEKRGLTEPQLYFSSMNPLTKSSLEEFNDECLRKRDFFKRIKIRPLQSIISVYGKFANQLLIDDLMKEVLEAVPGLIFSSQGGTVMYALAETYKPVYTQAYFPSSIPLEETVKKIIHALAPSLLNLTVTINQESINFYFHHRILILNLRPYPVSDHSNVDVGIAYFLNSQDLDSEAAALTYHHEYDRIELVYLDRFRTAVNYGINIVNPYHQGPLFVTKLLEAQREGFRPFIPLSLHLAFNDKVHQEGEERYQQHETNDLVTLCRRFIYRNEKIPREILFRKKIRSLSLWLADEREYFFHSDPDQVLPGEEEPIIDQEGNIVLYQLASNFQNPNDRGKAEVILGSIFRFNLLPQKDPLDLTKNNKPEFYLPFNKPFFLPSPLVSSPAREPRVEVVSVLKGSSSQGSSETVLKISDPEGRLSRLSYFSGLARWYKREGKEREQDEGVIQFTASFSSQLEVEKLFFYLILGLSPIDLNLNEFEPGTLPNILTEITEYYCPFQGPDEDLEIIKPVLQFLREEIQTKGLFSDDFFFPLLRAYTELYAVHLRDEGFRQEGLSEVESLDQLLLHKWSEKPLVPLPLEQNPYREELQVLVGEVPKRFQPLTLRPERGSSSYRKEIEELVSVPGVVVAGSSVLGLKFEIEAEDIDIFLVNPYILSLSENREGSDLVSSWTRSKVEQIIQIITSFVKERESGLEIYDSANSLTFALTNNRSHAELKIQIIKRVYTSIQEILLGFDLDSSAIALTQTNYGKEALQNFTLFSQLMLPQPEIVYLDRFRLAATYGLNVLNPYRQSLNFGERLTKYHRRGFIPFIPKGLFSPLDFYHSLAGHIEKNQISFLYADIFMGTKLGKLKNKESLSDQAKPPLKNKESPSDQGESDYERGSRLIYNIKSKNQSGTSDEVREEFQQYLETLRNNPSQRLIKFSVKWGFPLEQQSMMDILDLAYSFSNWRIYEPGTQLTGSFHPTSFDYYQTTNLTLSQEEKAYDLALDQTFSVPYRIDSMRFKTRDVEKSVIQKWVTERAFPTWVFEEFVMLRAQSGVNQLFHEKPKVRHDSLHNFNRSIKSISYKILI